MRFVWENRRACGTQQLDWAGPAATFRWRLRLRQAAMVGRSHVCAHMWGLAATVVVVVALLSVPTCCHAQLAAGGSSSCSGATSCAPGQMCSRPAALVQAECMDCPPGRFDHDKQPITECRGTHSCLTISLPA